MGKKANNKPKAEKPFTPEPPQVMDPSKPLQKENQAGKTVEKKK